MKTLEEKIEVMQAVLVGAKIEMSENDNCWEDVKNPDFNWCDYDYRIKHENKQVPFDFSDAESLIGRKIKDKKSVSLITDVFDEGIIGGGTVYFFKYLAEHYEIWNETLNQWRPCTKTVKA